MTLAARRIGAKDGKQYVNRAYRAEEVEKVQHQPSHVPVVAGVDGSASGLAAVRAAADHAALYGCPLLIVHAYNWLPQHPADAHPAETAHRLVEQAVLMAREVAPGLTVTTRLLEGAASAMLLRQARFAALLAIGDGGLSADVCLPMHASAVKVAARAACSVLIARSRPAHRGTVHVGGPILVGVNGSPASIRALDFAFDVAARRGVPLVVARVEPSATLAGSRALTDLVGPREEKYRVTADVRTRPGDPADVLVTEAQRVGLVIVGARGRQPYGGLLGSAAQALLQHCPAPLILVRGQMPVPLERSGRRVPAAASG